MTPRTLGWHHIGFAVRQLAPGTVWSARSPREERCLVLLRGSFEASWGAETHRIGPREDVFAGYPHAVYIPPGVAFRVRADRATEIADCRVVSRARRRAPESVTREGGPRPRRSAPESVAREGGRVIRPEDCGFEIRGGGNATRQIVDIVPPAFPADRLLICEVYTPSGNWSSYPPHKHDTDDPPREVDLDEIYYFRFRDETAGYGLQRLYGPRHDDTLRVEHGDVVAVHDGYHTFVTAHGYDAYYLNVLAGERRSMAASDDPAHARFRREWPPPDPRVPMVTRPSVGGR